jgi:hypothetical protein
MNTTRITGTEGKPSCKQYLRLSLEFQGKITTSVNLVSAFLRFCIPPVNPQLTISLNSVTSSALVSGLNDVVNLVNLILFLIQEHSCTRACWHVDRRGYLLFSLLECSPNHLKFTTIRRLSPIKYGKTDDRRTPDGCEDKGPDQTK